MTLAKKCLFHALISALLAITACLIYHTIYSKALDVDFSTVLNTLSIIGANSFGCASMGVAYYLGFKLKNGKGIGWINVLITVLSFASITVVFVIQLPFDLANPELFPGLAIPMHFFPALSFFTLAPFFK
jgi:hypothetical protein